MAEVHYVQKRRGPTELRRHTFRQFDSPDRAVEFAKRIAGKYSVEYVLVREVRLIHHFKWLAEAE
jgi:hypothetical protein